MTETDQVTLHVDDRDITAEKGTSLLQACLDNDIYIPNLCYLEKSDHPSASCRLCLVETNGRDRPVTSCTVKVTQGMRVKTDTPAVRRLQRSAFELLLSVHKVECRTCPANKKCELQKIAKFLNVGLKVKNLELYLRDVEVDTNHPVLDYFPNRCVLCGKCIQACETHNHISILTFSGRGFNTLVRYYGKADRAAVPCESCMACVDICPVSALIPRRTPVKNSGKL